MIGERIKQIRNALDITQGEMAVKVNLRQGSLSDIERGKVQNVTDRFIKDICREFNVNETWLRYGAGDMFVLYSNDMIAEFEKKLKLGKVFRSALKSYIEADEFTRKVIDNFLIDVVNGVIDLSDNEYRMEDDADEDKPAR